MDVRCSRFLDVANEPQVESSRDFRISVSKRETNECPVELSLTTWQSRGEPSSARRIEPVVPLCHGQGLAGIHSRCVRAVLAVDGNLHQQVHQPPDVVEHAREHEVEEPIVALG